MKLKTISIAVFALASVLLFGYSVYAEEQNSSSGGCTTATLNGAYGFYRTGVNEFGPFAAVGIFAFDGNGNGKVRQFRSLNGDFKPNSGTFTYTVAADCTSKNFADGAEFARVVIVDGGKEMYFISESNQTVYGVAKKVHP
jgi:hypothetical protein